MKTSTIVIIIAVLVVVLGGVMLFNRPVAVTGNITGGTVGGNTGGSSEIDNTRVITVESAKFAYSPGEMRVKKGEHIKIMVDNTDFQHGIAIPAFGVSGVDSVEFTADKTGTFEYRCPTPCGSGHMNMKGVLIVEE
ncbi:cupredoxin domain-containing protein [Candidatus Pacearchaeota archaeon]|nr:cupredoxin domain-containing protein [Candidatus Pacearchaeota archaeon]